jgi:phospholipid/cholesterol/gamma-HCH transport system ATP-binding protein
MAALVTPQSGRVEAFGQALSVKDRQALYAARRRMGLLFQFGALFTDLSCFENVAFPLREHCTLPESMIRDLVLLKLESVGLRGAASLMPSQISGGMARRVALARAIALDPELILYDEPFAGLDPISLGVTARLIRRLNDALGASSVVVTHDVAETFLIADQVAVLAPTPTGARLVAMGTPAALQASDDPYLRQFLKGEEQGPVAFHYPATDIAQAFCLGETHRGH